MACFKSLISRLGSETEKEEKYLLQKPLTMGENLIKGNDICSVLFHTF